MQRQADQNDPRTAIAMGRRYRRQTQAQLAMALTRETGEPWSRVMVGKLESGGKVLDVDTLMAIARIQGLPYSFYLEGPATRTIPGSLISALTIPLPGSESWGYPNSDVVPALALSA